MLVILAIVAYFLGQVAAVGALALTAVLALSARNAAALLPLVLAGAWVAGTVDFVDLFDGPMRMQAVEGQLELQGGGRGVVAFFSDGDGGPAWWIPTTSAACFALFTTWPKLPNMRPAAFIGLASIATCYAGLAALNWMYAA